MTRRHLSWYIGLALTLAANVAYSQGISHSDVFFTYGETQIQVEPQDGRMVIPQRMPESGFFAQANTNPGFFSERDVGGGTGPNDIVGYNVLGDLSFWSDGEFSSPRPGTEIRVINNPSFVDDTVIGTASGEQRALFDPLSNSIGQSGDSGDFHAHVDFRLEPLSDDPEETPSLGAYGIKLSLTSNNEAVQESDPFFIVFQFGIGEDQFIEALDDFEALLLASPGLLGDFNADKVLSDADIDMLSAEVRVGSNAISFDITDDQLVNELDRIKWVEELAGTFFGDADLDGRVQFADFLALSNSFGTIGGWANGDFDGDGKVQFPDFLVLSNNFGKGSASQTASVPEPLNSTSIGIVLAMLAGFCRERDACSANFRQQTMGGRSAASG